MEAAVAMSEGGIPGMDQCVDYDPGTRMLSTTWIVSFLVRKVSEEVDRRRGEVGQEGHGYL